MCLGDGRNLQTAKERRRAWRAASAAEEIRDEELTEEVQRRFNDGNVVLEQRKSAEGQNLLDRRGQRRSNVSAKGNDAEQRRTRRDRAAAADAKTTEADKNAQRPRNNCHTWSHSTNHNSKINCNGKRKSNSNNTSRSRVISTTPSRSQRAPQVARDSIRFGVQPQVDCFRAQREECCFLQGHLHVRGDGCLTQGGSG